MKGLVIVLTLSLAYGGVFLGQQIGESCEKTPEFTVQVFDASPWPIGRTQQYTIHMNGVFTSKEYVKEIYIALKDGKGFWHYNYQTVGQEYAKNAAGNFTISIEGPSDKGSYTSQIILHRNDLSTIACWQYYYVIN